MLPVPLIQIKVFSNDIKCNTFELCLSGFNKLNERSKHSLFDFLHTSMLQYVFNPRALSAQRN